METEHAARIVEALADGADPSTGEKLNPNGPLSQPEIIRALSRAARALRATDTANVEKRPTLECDTETVSQSPSKQGGPWTPAETSSLTSAWFDGQSVAEIAEHHGRSQGAIYARCLMMGMIARDGGEIRCPSLVPQLEDQSRRGEAWTVEEEKRLADEWIDGQWIRDIAAAHGRSPGAIASRLTMMGIVDSSIEAWMPLPRRSLTDVPPDSDRIEPSLSRDSATIDTVDNPLPQRADVDWDDRSSAIRSMMDDFSDEAQDFSEEDHEDEGDTTERVTAEQNESVNCLRIEPDILAQEFEEEAANYARSAEGGWFYDDKDVSTASQPLKRQPPAEELDS